MPKFGNSCPQGAREARGCEPVEFRDTVDKDAGEEPRYVGEAYQHKIIHQVP